MGYSNTYSNKPFERASKTAHTAIIKDSDVKDFIGKCIIPPAEFDDGAIERNAINIGDETDGKIANLIAVDGGYTEDVVRQDFPSAKIAFFQFGVLLFKEEDLRNLKTKPFISPEDMSKLQDINRSKLVVPTKGIIYDNCSCLTESVRRSVYQFFLESNDGGGD